MCLRTCVFVRETEKWRGSDFVYVACILFVIQIIWLLAACSSNSKLNVGKVGSKL